MDTNHNANSDSLIPKQPVIGAGPSTAATSKLPVPPTASSSSNTIGSHNVASLRMASGRSLAGVSSSSSSSSSSASSSLVQLRQCATRAVYRSPVTPAKLQFLVLGSSGSGKTSLLRRLQNLNATVASSSSSCSSSSSKSAASSHQGTIGPDLHRLKCGQVEAIDIGGADNCYPIAQAYAELFDVFVVLFDITSAESFLIARYWMERLVQRGGGSSPEVGESPSTRMPPTILLVGNKVDLVSADGKSRQVPSKLARNLALTFEAQYIEISAKHDLTLAEAVLDRLEAQYKRNLEAVASGQL